MIRSLTALALAAILGGCSAEYQAAKELGIAGAAKAADTALADAIWLKCKAASIGSVERRYMASRDLWAVWTQECLGAGAIELPDFQVDPRINPPNPVPRPQG